MRLADSPGVARALRAGGPAPATLVVLHADPAALRGEAPAEISLVVCGTRVQAWRGDTIVSSAGWTAPADGASEVVDVATHPAHRRQGLAGAVTVAAARAAATRGADLVWLRTDDPAARRVYEAAGFSPVRAGPPSRSTGPAGRARRRR